MKHYSTAKYSHQSHTDLSKAAMRVSCKPKRKDPDGGLVKMVTLTLCEDCAFVGVLIF